MHRRPLSYFLLLMVCAIPLACGIGSNSGTDKTVTAGTIYFSLVWEKTAAFTPAVMRAAVPDVCIDHGLQTISGTVINSAGTVVSSASWSCSAHTGTIDNVPIGSNLTFRVEGIDSTGATQWRGQAANITLVSNQPYDAGIVAMAYIGTDRTSPIVISWIPAKGETNVYPTAKISAAFNKSLAHSTVTETTFLLTAGTTSIPGTVSYDDAAKTATFTPASSLTFSTLYTVTLTNGITDMSDNAFVPLSWSFTTQKDALIPPGPPFIIATASTGRATVTWQPVSHATSYSLYRSLASGVTRTNGMLVSNTAVSPYQDAGLKVLTTYYYVATAANAWGESRESNEITVNIPPPAPANTAATAGNGQNTISWTDAAGVGGYTIYWSLSPGVTTAAPNRITTTMNPYLHANLQNGATYYYIVTAVSTTYGESSASREISAMPMAP